MRNWNTEFKPEFQNAALLFGAAGEMIFHDSYNYAVQKPPSFNAVEVIFREGENEINSIGEEEEFKDFEIEEEEEVSTDFLKDEEDAEGNRKGKKRETTVRKPSGRMKLLKITRIYRDDESGRRKYEYDQKRYFKFVDDKRKLTAALFDALSEEVRAKVGQHKDWTHARREYDILKQWRIVEEIVVGRGAVSLYTQIAKLIKVKQSGEDFTGYMKSFKDLVLDIQNQGYDPEVLVSKIFDVIFIIGLNQSMFKDQLNIVYGKRNWPSYEDFGEDLREYADATSKMKLLREEDNDGRLVAHIANGNSDSPVGCWNCGKSGHMSKECKRPQAKCGKCGRNGHVDKFCDISSSKNYRS
jgi:hypothetical protein